MATIGPSNPYSYQPPSQVPLSHAKSLSLGDDDPASFSTQLLTFYGSELGDALQNYIAQQNPQTLHTLLITLRAMENSFRDQGNLIDAIKLAQCSIPPPAMQDVGTALEAAYSCASKLVQAQASITNAMAVNKMPNPYELLNLIGTVSATPDPNADTGTVWGDMQVVNNSLAPSSLPPPPYVPIPGTGASPQIQNDTLSDAAAAIQGQSITNIQAAFDAYQANPKQGFNALLQTLIQADQDLRADTDGLIQVLETAEGPNPDDGYTGNGPPPDAKVMGAIAQSYTLASQIIAAENLLIQAGQQGVLPNVKAFAKILGTPTGTDLKTIWGSINSIVSWLQPSSKT